MTQAVHLGTALCNLGTIGQAVHVVDRIEVNRLLDVFEVHTLSTFLAPRVRLRRCVHQWTLSKIHGYGFVSQRKARLLPRQSNSHTVCG